MSPPRHHPQQGGQERDVDSNNDHDLGTTRGDGNRTRSPVVMMPPTQLPPEVAQEIATYLRSQLFAPIVGLHSPLPTPPPIPCLCFGLI